METISRLSARLSMRRHSKSANRQSRRSLRWGGETEKNEETQENDVHLKAESEPPVEKFEEAEMEYKRWKVHFAPRFTSEKEVKENGGKAPKNTFMTPPASDFFVRGKGYLRGNKVVDRSLKIVSNAAPYEIVGVHVFRAHKTLDHIATKESSLIEHIAAEQSIDDPELAAKFPQFLVICWTFKSTWGREHTSVAHLFRRKDDLIKQFSQDEINGGAAFIRSFSRFMDGTQQIKSERLKFIPKVREASPSLKKSVTVLGGEKPVLIAKKLHTHFFKGSNYLEIDQDVGSSMVASMLNSTVLKASASMVIDTSWLIEAKDEDELPERLLAMVRWNYVNPSTVFIELDENFKPKSAAS